MSRVIPGSAEEIFAVLASPQGHVDMDGSGTVRSVISGDDPLKLGSKFRMRMKMGVPYRMANTIAEYEENRLIAWAHIGKHRWRFELEEAEGGTKVTETFDWSTSPVSKAIELAGYPKKHPKNMDATLERLERVVLDRRS